MDKPTVVEALARVIECLPGIGKDQESPQGYKYRGIEQITRIAQPLFAEHGIVYVPKATAYEVRDIVVNNKPWTDTVLTVEYRIYGPAGDFLEGCVVAIGRDNSDKGANKAMSQAFKYMLLQTLCISDAADDSEAHPAAERDAPPVVDAEAITALQTRVSALPESLHDEFMAWKAGHEFPWPWPIDAVQAMNARIADLLLSEPPPTAAAERPQEAPSEPEQSEGPGTATGQAGGDEAGETAVEEDRPVVAAPEDQPNERAAAAAAQLLAVELRRDVEREVAAMNVPAVRDLLMDFGEDADGLADVIRPRLVDRLVAARAR